MPAPIESDETLAKQQAQNIEKLVTPLFNVVELFDHLDKNKNGLGLAELNRGVPDKQSNASNAIDDNRHTLPLVVLKTCRQEFKLLSDDGSINNARISLKDRDQFAKIPPMIAMRWLAGSYHILRSLDSNKDDWITKDEIKAGLSAAPNGGVKTAMQTTLDHFDVISNNQGFLHVSQFHPQVSQFVKAQLSPAQEALAQKALGYVNDANERLIGANGEIFADKGTGPIAEFVKQHSIIGDCEPLATFCSLAARNPAAIRELITENPDGKTLTVKFPFPVDGQLISSVIPKPNRKELAMYSGSGQNGMWVSVLLKGLGQYFKDHPDRYEKLTGMRLGPELASKYNTPAYEYLNGSDRSYVLEALTGKAPEKIDLQKIDIAALEKALIASQSKPIVLVSSIKWPHQIIDHPGTPNDKLAAASPIGATAAKTKAGDQQQKPSVSPTHVPDQNNDDPDDPESEPIKGNDHAFALLAYNPERKTVTVYNPWQMGELITSEGKTIDGKDDGKMEELHLSDVPIYFNCIYVPRTS